MTSKYYILTFWSVFVFTVHLFSFSGKRNNVWAFGDSAGVDFNITGNPTAISTASDYARGTCSIADTSGRLLFYASSGIRSSWSAGWLPIGGIYNSDHQLMVNGDSVNSRGWYHDILIVPNPANNQTSYVFHIGVTDLYGLYFTIVDLTQDSGRGAVVSKNNVLDTIAAVDCLQAVKHGNGRDWWVFFRQWEVVPNNEFYVYLVDSTGIQLHSIQSIGELFSSGGGDLVFNSNGSQFAFCNWKGQLELYDFDRCTGAITLNQTIEQEDNVNFIFPYYASVAFSPNDSLLYVVSWLYNSTGNPNDNYIFQYDLSQPNIASTRDTIASYRNPRSPGAVRLAPDNKIYISCGQNIYPYGPNDYDSSNTYLSVIHQPDQRGAACDFRRYDFYLGGKRCYWGLPNNPDYDLPPLAGSVCDTITTGLTETDQRKELLVYPNPAHETVRIRVPETGSGIYRVTLLNMLSETVLDNETPLQHGHELELSLRNVPAGIYLLKMETERGWWTGRVVVN